MRKNTCSMRIHNIAGLLFRFKRRWDEKNDIKFQILKEEKYEI